MREKLTILVIVGTSTEEHSLRNQVGMGSESDCLFGQLDSDVCGLFLDVEMRKVIVYIRIRFDHWSSVFCVCKR